MQIGPLPKTHVQIASFIRHERGYTASANRYIDLSTHIPIALNFWEEQADGENMRTVTLSEPAIPTIPTNRYINLLMHIPIILINF